MIINFAPVQKTRSPLIYVSKYQSLIRIKSDTPSVFEVFKIFLFCHGINFNEATNKITFGRILKKVRVDSGWNCEQESKNHANQK